MLYWKKGRCSEYSQLCSIAKPALGKTNHSARYSDPGSLGQKPLTLRPTYTMVYVLEKLVWILYKVLTIHRSLCSGQCLHRSG